MRQVEIVKARSGEVLGSVLLNDEATVEDLKQQLEEKLPKYGISRQSIREEPNGKMLPDEKLIKDTCIFDTGKAYFKDLGPQISWSFVFLCEYIGPIFAYLLFYFRPQWIYGDTSKSAQPHPVVFLACVAYVGHYVKRVLETLFLHKFSHATMPWFNLVKNCSYYWGFSGLISYFVNHPLYTAPHYGMTQVYIGLAGMVFNELGNLSIHHALSNLRPPGTKVRKIPQATASNPFTILFNFVSCPNYTYEAGSWLFFTMAVQSLAALLFTLAGFYQMALWAVGKHKRYRKEFKDYPRGRKAILPFIL